MTVSNETTAAPTIGPEQIALLERLTNAVAVSGDEREVRAIVLEALQGQVDEIKVDVMGSVLAVKRAAVPNPVRVMLAAHMDEVGFMLVDEDEDGLFRFEIVGGIDVRQLPGKPVLVGKDHVPGVIGARPIHLTTADERKQAISLDSLRIDLGPTKPERVKVGDRATFATRFRQEGPSLCAKAIDDRIGVATLIELVKHAPSQIELLAAFTVQEEVGLRGAQTAAYALNPDIGIALDSVPAMDLPMWDDTENDRYNTRLGLGPALYLADSHTLADPRLARLFIDTAESVGIPYQIRQPGGGGTDAGAIHLQRSGIPSISVSVPGRYAHTAMLIARLSDWENTLALVHAALSRMSAALLEQER